MKLTHVLGAILLLALPGCAQAPLSSTAANDGWTINRYSGYCAANRQSFGNALAFVQTIGGPVGWNITDTSGRAKPGPIYPIVMSFADMGTLRFTGVVGGDSRLSNNALDPVTAERLSRYAAGAPSVSVSSPVLGDMGNYDLSGSAAAMAQLHQCAGGNGAPTS